MGLVSRTQSDAKRNAQKRGSKKRGQMSANLRVAKSTDDFLAKFPKELQHKVLKKAIRAAGGPVRRETRARLINHRSAQTGTREKWSQKVQEQRSKRDRDLYESIQIKIRDYGPITWGGVGARWPQGAHFHLLEFGGTRILWGGESITASPTPTLRPAGDSTKAEQKKALIGKVQKEWRKV